MGTAPDGGLTYQLASRLEGELQSAAAYQVGHGLLAEFLTDYTQEITGSAAAAYSSEKFPEAVALCEH